MEKTKRVSIIIPTLNAEGYLPLLIDALKTQTHVPEEILIIDSESTDQTCAIAEQEQICLLELFLKVGPVHAPLAVVLQEAVFQNLPVPGLGHVVKLGVHRRLDQHAAALRGEELHHSTNGLDHAQAEAHELGVDVPAVAALLPAPDGLKVALRTGGVAPDALLSPGSQGVDDGLGGLEVHVRDPKVDHVVGAEFLLPLVVLGGVVAGAVNDLIKIILHTGSSFPVRDVECALNR